MGEFILIVILTISAVTVNHKLEKKGILPKAPEKTQVEVIEELRKEVEELKCKQSN